jgi:hypothetical protein
VRPHQAVVLETVDAFLAFYSPRAAAVGINRVGPRAARDYAQWVDRALLVFQWFAQPDERLALYDTSGRLPTVQRAVAERVTVQLLTQALTADCSRADAFGTLLPLWVADRWLAACGRADLFAKHPWPPATPGHADVSHTRWVQLFCRVLNQAPVSALGCHALLHG